MHPDKAANDTTPSDPKHPNDTTPSDPKHPNDTTPSDPKRPEAAPDHATAIVNELNRYAELIDAGRFTELGELMEHCAFHYGTQRSPGPTGAAAIAGSYRSAVITYHDGTPRTRHITTNPIIELDGDTARVRSVYTVLQQAPDSAMQAIISGRYHDTLKRIDGRWRFTERCFLVDLVGDLSRHLRFELSPEHHRATTQEGQP